ncbi:restriction system protein [Kitasatospora herbaricolor]|uniref:restriction endonuclease n=1 Tax=Kitasatospora herbaricolor TaxID=68217 RepID=UPI001E302A2C|nr:restriction endonuclease [Kitasatospora herbaricolor]MDQ0305471.1 restriction system protein [Kitasatospora herbaricolor]
MRVESGSVVLAAVALIVGVSLLLAVLRWLAAHWWVPLLVLLAAAGVGAAVFCARAAQERLAQEGRRALRLALTGPGGIDQLGHDAFEYAVRDLLIRDGCRARKVGQSNDQSVDVLADDPLGRRWALQCKHKQDPVGGKAVGVGVLYSLAGTYQRVHRAQVPVVVTNGRFSRDAVKWGAEQGVLLVDRELLGRWASSGRPLWELMPRVPAPRSGHRS